MLTSGFGDLRRQRNEVLTETREQCGQGRRASIRLILIQERIIRGMIGSRGRKAGFLLAGPPHQTGGLFPLEPEDRFEMRPKFGKIGILSRIYPGLLGQRSRTCQLFDEGSRQPS